MYIVVYLAFFKCELVIVDATFNVKLLCLSQLGFLHCGLIKPTECVILTFTIGFLY